MGRVTDWLAFADLVSDHIETYTIEQFGDTPNDQVESWTPAACILAIRKYTERYGKGQRGELEQLRDLLKIAHYAQLAFDKECKDKGINVLITTKGEWKLTKQD